jgi:hypothetical protein
MNNRCILWDRVFVFGGFVFGRGVGSLFSGYTFHFVVSYLMGITFFDAAFGVWVVIFIEVVAMLLFGNRSFLGRLATSACVGL